MKTIVAGIPPIVLSFIVELLKGLRLLRLEGDCYTGVETPSVACGDQQRWVYSVQTSRPRGHGRHCCWGEMLPSSEHGAGFRRPGTSPPLISSGFWPLQAATRTTTRSVNYPHFVSTEPACLFRLARLERVFSFDPSSELSRQETGCPINGSMTGLPSNVNDCLPSEPCLAVPHEGDTQPPSSLIAALPRN